MPSWPKSSLAFLPYSRLELPGWGKILHLAGVTRRTGWEAAPTRVARGKNHGYLMPLDLSNWSERLSYFLGRHHEVPTALFLKAAVRPGDTFIDVGGNIGMITLHAAALVGPTGRVHTFEPNPALVTRLQKLIDLNHLTHVTLHPAGLADAPAELTLRILHNHTGQGTLATIPTEDQSAVTQEYKVPIQVGDDALPPDLPAAPATLKIDVEGYELHALRGLRRTLDRLHPTVFTEVSPEYLQRAGASVPALIDYMRSHGYTPHNLTATRRGLTYALRLTPAKDAATLTTDNVVWIHPDSEGAARLRPHIS